jgi:hypothetical protein
MKFLYLIKYLIFYYFLIEIHISFTILKFYFQIRNINKVQKKQKKFCILIDRRIKNLNYLFLLKIIIYMNFCYII